MKNGLQSEGSQAVQFPEGDRTTSLEQLLVVLVRSLERLQQPKR